eukprot:15352091-Ditylum_brightwellii.AAC.2
MKNNKYCKYNQYNLFSLTKRLKNGWLLYDNTNVMWINKGGHKVSFDICIKTKEGIIFAAYMKRVPMIEVANAGAGFTLVHQANVPKAMRYQVFSKAFKSATLLNSAVVIEVNGKKRTQYEHFCGKLPKILKYLKQWREAGTVKVQIKTTPKLNDRGVTCMMVGYAIQHKANCYKILDLHTGTIYEACDIIWLKCMYYQKALMAGEEKDMLQPWPSNSDPNAGAPTVTVSEIDADNDAVDTDNDNKEDTNNDNYNNKSIQAASEGEIIPVLEPPAQKVTQSGQVSRIPAHLAENYKFIGHTGDVNMKRVDATHTYHQISLTSAEHKYYAQIRKLNKLSFCQLTRTVSSWRRNAVF